MPLPTSEERLVVLEVGHDRLASDIAKIDVKLDALNDKLTNRLPAWATFVFSFMSLMCGGLLGALITVVN